MRRSLVYSSPATVTRGSHSAISSFSSPLPRRPRECITSKPSPYRTPFHILLDPILNQQCQYPPDHLSSYAPLFEFLTGRDLLKLGQQIHAHMTVRGFEPNAFLAAKMVAMYGSSDHLDSAAVVFSRVQNPSSLLYNSIIRAYTTNGYPLKSIDVYVQMRLRGVKGDYFTFPFVLKCCAEISAVGIGQCVHGHCLKMGLVLDSYVGPSLIDMYVKCGQLKDARELFDEMPVRDLTCWNALIAGYMKEGEIRTAEDLFLRMPFKNIVSWTAMISGYTQNGLTEQSLSLFDEMMREDSEMKPNRVTIMSVLPACADSAALERGRRIHQYASSIGLGSNPSVQTALVSMYSKCGSLDDARRCFDRTHPSERSTSAWNSMISAYASHGRWIESVSTFEEMIRSGVRPDPVTFTALLSACTQSGLIGTGLKYLRSMRTAHHVEPTVEHYACAVDMFGRSGKLVEAMELIESMPMHPGPSIWGALLAAGRNHGNLEIAEIAAGKLFVLELNNLGTYVILSNVYAETGMWKEVDDLRAFLRCQGMRKTLGCSWIEVFGKTQFFLSGDTSHPQAREIYKLVGELPWID